MIESIVTDAVKLLLSQTISLYKTKKKEKALENNLSILLNDVAEEPFYDDICKLIGTGALKKQLIRYCENVPLDGPTIAKRCSDIANACNGDSFNQSRIYDIIFKIAVSFFYIINEPDNSEIRAVINYSNLNTATIRKDIQKLADMLSEFMKWQSNKTDGDEPNLQIPKFINPPYPKNDYFSNRKDILDEIHKGFSSGATIQYLTGQSGIGKTQIALEYAFRNEADYTHILWVNAETETKIMESYQKFIDTLQPLSVPKEEQSNAVIIRNVFRWMDTHDNWLFIYDNIEDVTGDIPWCPKCNRGNCLFTTQKTDLEFGNKFEVTEFSPDEAVRFLEKRTKKRDTDTMKDVAKRLGYHPLALEQAAAYLVHNKNTTFAAYSQLLTKHGLTALEETKDKDIINYHKSVTATMEISIAKIKTEAAIQLLYLCSYLSSENIDPNLFYETSELLPDPLQTQLSDTLTRNRVWRALTEYSLFAFHEEKDGYSVHRLLQEVIRRQIGEDRQWAQHCLAILRKVFDFEYGDIDSHNNFIKLLPHVEAFLNHTEFYLTDQTAQEEIANLYAEGGWGHFRLGNYAQAMTWCQKALVIREKVLGTEHTDTATTYNNIAAVYDRQGEYAMALELHQKALAIREKVLGKEHPSTAATYNNIAGVYEHQGEYANALEWYQKALAIDEKVLGKEHPSTAATYNNIAGVYERQGEYANALEWYQKALAIRDKVLGKEHPDTAATYNNIATVYDRQGEYAMALEWYQKALAIDEKVLGKEHPDTAANYNNIATVYNHQGEYAMALEWYQKALAICEKVLGKEHPDTAATYHNIAMVYNNQGEYAMALEWYQKALAIKEIVLGKEHPDTAATYNNIAMVYERQGEYAMALEWFQKALVIREKVPGKEHPDTAATYNNIAAVYNHQSEYAMALEWYQKALAIKEKVLGKEHPDTAITYHNIAAVYDHQGEYAMALEWFQKALVIREKVPGKEHPDTAATYNNIAAVYNHQSEYAMALEWYQKALAIFEKVLGKEHPATAATYNNIAAVYDRQGEYAKALAWYQKALVIREKVPGKEHPDTAATYNNIAAVYDRQGEYAMALEWHQKALAIRKKVLGKEHPDTAVTYNNIAAVYYHQGEYAKALAWFEKAYAILTTKLGKDHPDTKTTAENIWFIQEKIHPDHG